MLRNLTRDEVLTRLDIAYDILLTTSVMGDKLFTETEKDQLHETVDFLRTFSDELDKSYFRRNR